MQCYFLYTLVCIGDVVSISISISTLIVLLCCSHICDNCDNTPIWGIRVSENSGTLSLFI